MRYHKGVFFPADSEYKLSAICDKLNIQPWGYTKHCLNRIKQKLECTDILQYIKLIKILPQNIFEYYTDNLAGEVEKIVLRIPYKGIWDVIIVVDNNKVIVTIYAK